MRLKKKSMCEKRFGTLIAIADWCVNGEVGASSNALAARAAGVKTKNNNHPHDPADFNRCLLFLHRIPNPGSVLEKMRSVSPEWDALVERWREISTVFVAEVGWNWCEKSSAPVTYALMASILSSVRK
ncbi:MAG: hypothetical protein WC477_06900 [Patescibacteria group bacterium]